MKIISARWSPQVNKLVIQCQCSNTFEHRADRFLVVCEKCGETDQVESLREQFMNEAKIPPLPPIGPAKPSVEWEDDDEG